MDYKLCYNIPLQITFYEIIYFSENSVYVSNSRKLSWDLWTFRCLRTTSHLPVHFFAFITHLTTRPAVVI